MQSHYIHMCCPVIKKLTCVEPLHVNQYKQIRRNVGEKLILNIVDIFVF